MFCKNCGRQLDEGENFCPVCGTMNATEPSTETPVDTSVSYDTNAVDTTNEHLKDEMAGQVFKWGLMGMIFTCTGCLSLLGFIFSIIAKSRATAYQRTYGEITGRAQAGRILGRIGFGMGLGMTIFFTVYFLIVFAALLVELM